MAGGDMEIVAFPNFSSDQGLHETSKLERRASED